MAATNERGVRVPIVRRFREVLLPGQSFTIRDAFYPSPSRREIQFLDNARRPWIELLAVDATTIDRLGTMAIAGSAAWADVVWTVGLRADDDDAVGFVFRYVDNSNYYRFLHGPASTDPPKPENTGYWPAGP